MNLNSIQNLIYRGSLVGVMALTLLTLIGGFQNCTPSFQTLASQSVGLNGVPVGLRPFRYTSADVAGTPTSVGLLFYATDTTISGCAYDTANPSVHIQVHAYSEAGLRPVIGLAAYGCPWTSDPAYQGHGFQIQYRRPLSSPNNVNIAYLNADLTAANWASTNQAAHLINNFNRAQSTFLYQTASYQIGISLKYGAGISEFYNNRVDPTMNLVTADPGAMIQTAIFGDSQHQAFGGTNCMGSQDDRYNPTQAGSSCADANGSMLGSNISDCTSSQGNALCQQLVMNNQNIDDRNPDWLQYKVHYRNFYYPNGITNYQTYDDIYGYVRYEFHSQYASVKYQDWKTTGTTFGSTFQQMPVAFLNQITKLSTDSLVMQRQPSDDRDYANSQSYPFTAGKSHWVLAEAIDNRPLVPNSTAGNFLTMAFYSAIIDGSGASNCPSRNFQGDLLGASSPSDQSWLTVQHSSVFQNAMINVTAQAGLTYQAQAILSPYRPAEIVGGQALSRQVDLPQSQGGLSPTWECNQANPQPVFAFTANTANLWVAGSVGTGNQGLGMMAHTSPSMAAPASGGYVVAFQANTSHLWIVGNAGAGDTGLGMMANTNPSIAALSGGGYVAAFQANTGNLWVVGNAGSGDMGLGMMANTSPSIAALPGGGYVVAFQANTGNLWVVGNAGSGDMGLGMMAKTSPSIVALSSGGYEVAFQANTSHLWVAGNAGTADLGLGMMANSSPSIAAPLSGGYEVAFQANTGNLWLVGSVANGDQGLGMLAGTNPNILLLQP